jgi:hypothetical protein
MQPLYTFIYMQPLEPVKVVAKVFNIIFWIISDVFNKPVLKTSMTGIMGNKGIIMVNE